MRLNKSNIVHFYVQYVQSVHLDLRGGSEVEKVDKVLRGKGHGATFWVVGCAGMVCVLQKEANTTINIKLWCSSVLSLALLTVTF